MRRGSCMCGAVRYEVKGESMGMYYCHCRQCRKATGSTFATNIIVPHAAFRLLAGGDKLSAYESSPEKFRYFCSVCGSPVYSHSRKTSHVVSIRCGTLDTDVGETPRVHKYVASKAPWYEIRDGLPQQPEG